MKILLLNQFFWPDSSATSQLLTDLARALTAAGHEVTAICSDRGGYAAVSESPQKPPVRVFRVKALPFVRGTLGRVLSYLSFYLSAACRGMLLQKQHVVVTLTTPPLLPLLGTLVKKVRGSRHFIWEMDIYPDVAVDLGYFKAGGVLDRFVGVIADYSRHCADGVLALGECMTDRLIRRGISADRIWITHNWADGKAIVPQPRPGDPDKLILLYSGNIGLAHEFETVLASAEVLREDRRFEFLFKGTGARRPEIAAFIDRTGTSSVSLGDFVARSTLSDSLAVGDIGLVTQRPICCGSVVPSKIYGLLAAGRPILFIGPIGATPARLIQQFGCGWQIEPGDCAGLTALLKYLINHREEVMMAGLRARQALIQHFDLSHGVARILAVLEDKDTTDRQLNFPSMLTGIDPAPAG